MKGSLQYFRNHQKDTEAKACRLEQYTRGTGKTLCGYSQLFQTYHPNIRISYDRNTKEDDLSLPTEQLSLDQEKM